MTQEAMNLKVLEPFMERLDFVQWDRYVHGPDFVHVYGWIPRDDGKADFVLLAFWGNWLEEGYTTPTFWTSSSKYSEEIARRIFGDDMGGHVRCKRVEHAGLSLPNVIHLQPGYNPDHDEFTLAHN